MTVRRAYTLLLVTGLVATSAASAETARALLDHRKQLDDTTRHWDDREQHVALTIERKLGAPFERTVAIYERRLGAGEEQAVAFMLEPASVRGVAFLSYGHDDRADDQWVYLPALKKVRRISGNERNESFFETDLTYQDVDVLQDLVKWPEADAPATLLGEEEIDGTPTYKIELKPHVDDVDYSRILVWLAKDDLMARRTEMFAGDAEPRKIVEQSDIRLVDGIPVAFRLVASTPAKSSRSVMQVTAVRFNQHPESELFTQRALAQGAP